MRISIPDSVQAFYQKREKETSSQIVFSPGFPDSLISQLEIGGAKLDDRTWYLTWSYKEDGLWHRNLLSDTMAHVARSYQLENKTYYGYNLDVIGPGTEADKKLFVNGKLVEVEYLKADKQWFHPDFFESNSSLFDIAIDMINCCPVIYFQ